MLRIVADTNVYVSAFHFGGVTDEVLRLGRAGQVELFVSPALLVEGVFVGKFNWSSVRGSVPGLVENAGATFRSVNMLATR